MMMIEARKPRVSFWSKGLQRRNEKGVFAEAKSSAQKSSAGSALKKCRTVTNL